MTISDPYVEYRASLATPYPERPTVTNQPNAHLDDQDAVILRDRSIALGRLQGVRVGDFIRMKDGSERRITYHWGERVQTTDHGKAGSFYLGDGYISFSGGLDSAIPLDRVRLIHHIGRLGRVWFFHHDQWRAHNRVDGWLDFRVYEQV